MAQMPQTFKTNTSVSLERKSLFAKYFPYLKHPWQGDCEYVGAKDEISHVGSPFISMDKQGQTINENQPSQIKIRNCHYWYTYSL